MITYSLIQKLQLEGALRIDAEYYQPEYLKLEKVFQESTVDKIIDLSFFVKKGVFDLSPDNYRNEGMPFIRVQNIRNGFLDEESLVFLPDEVSQKEKKTELEPLDLVLSKVGTIGEISVIPSYCQKANFSQNVIGIKIDKKKVPPGFLLIYLLSKFGHLQLIRAQMFQVQAKLELQDVRNLEVVRLGKIENEIHKIVVEIEKLIELSKSLYSQAESLLLEKLGFKDFQIEDDLSFVVNFSEVKSANRVDAEYFQPKYGELISKIKRKNVKSLEKFIAHYSTGFPFKSNNYTEQGIPLIRINNIRKGYLDLSDTAFLTERDFSLSPKDTAKSGDIVVSMSGTIGMTAVIPVDVPKCAVNQRILKFTPKNIDKDLIALVLNTIIGKYQLEKIGTGGVQTNISYKDIKNILIPILPKLTQQKIAELVKKSHESRKKSKELLEEAKRMVEEMIEKGSSNGN